MPNPRLLEDEDFRADCLDAARMEGVHPVLRRIHAKPLPKRERCRACGFELDVDELTEDGLCCECDAEVKRLEAGLIR